MDKDISVAIERSVHDMLEPKDPGISVRKMYNRDLDCLEPHEKNLADKINDFYEREYFEVGSVRPREIYIGAMICLKRHKWNPDYIAQVAFSLLRLLSPIVEHARDECSMLEMNDQKSDVFKSKVIDPIFQCYGKLLYLSFSGYIGSFGSFTPIQCEISHSQLVQLVERSYGIITVLSTKDLRQMFEEFEI